MSTIVDSKLETKYDDKISTVSTVGPLLSGHSKNPTVRSNKMDIMLT